MSQTEPSCLRQETQPSFAHTVSQGGIIEAFELRKNRTEHDFFRVPVYENWEAAKKLAIQRLKVAYAEGESIDVRLAARKLLEELEHRPDVFRDALYKAVMNKSLASR